MILLDAVVAFLLFVSIIFSIRLNRSIAKLKEGKKEIAASVIEFSTALKSAEESIAKLKSLNSEIGNELRGNIESARFLANDLSFLIQKGNEVGDRLEGNVKLANDNNAAKSVMNLNKNQGGRTGDFNRRAVKIAEGQISGVYNNIVAEEEASLNTKGIARKYAMEQALELIARRNLAKVKDATPAQVPEEIAGKGGKQRRLFDALKWGRQLNS